MESSRLKKLIKRYQNGTASPAERYIVERWLESFQQEKESHPELGDAALASFHRQVLDRAFGGKRATLNYRRRWVAWVAAACVLCAVSLSWLLHVRQSGEGNKRLHQGTAQTLSTGIGQVKRLVLPDSTVVYLNANTVLEVTAGYGKGERAVKLEGEAYFEVKRDTLQPFRVQTDGLEVRVLGTAFNVNAYHALEDIQVAVSTGKVQISDARQVLALLEASEGLTYNRQTAEFQRVQVSPTDGASWREGISVLVDGSFDRLAQILRNHYGVTLESDDGDVRSVTYNFTIRSTRTLAQTMEQLCEMLNKHYRKEGNRVIIY